MGGLGAAGRVEVVAAGVDLDRQVGEHGGEPISHSLVVVGGC